MNTTKDLIFESFTIIFFESFNHVIIQQPLDINLFGNRLLEVKGDH